MRKGRFPMNTWRGSAKRSHARPCIEKNSIGNSLRRQASRCDARHESSFGFNIQAMFSKQGPMRSLIDSHVFIKRLPRTDGNHVNYNIIESSYRCYDNVYHFGFVCLPSLLIVNFSFIIRTLLIGRQLNWLLLLANRRF
ncbi:Uncharacterised protein r2_g725 [Pycnogonum litorale]